MEIVNIFILILSCFLSYLLGNISIARLITKKNKNGEITKQGSGNPGTMNMLRTHGIGMGIFTLLCDAIKGVLPALFGLLYFGKYDESIAYMTLYFFGFCAVLGHIFPAPLRFRGGKGFAPYIGMTLALNWRFALVILVLIVLITLITDYIAIGTFTTVISFPVYSALIVRHYWLAAIVAIASAVILYRHRENIKRIANGTEIGLRRARKTSDSHH